MTISGWIGVDLDGTLAYYDGWKGETQTVLIQEWCEKYIGQKLDVTCKKDFGMIELWDDRAVQVVINTGIPVSK